MGIPINTADTKFDYVLQNFAMRLGNGSLIAEEYAPIVPSDQHSFRYPRFDDSALTLFNMDRAFGSRIKHFSWDFSTDRAEITQEAIAYKLTKESLRAVGVHGVALDQQATRKTNYALDLSREFRVSQLISNPINFPTGNKLTLVAGTQWSAPTTSTPSLDIDAARTAIFDKTGFYPNVTVCSLNAFKALQRHPETRSRFSNNSNSMNNFFASEKAIAEAYGLGKLLVGNAAYRPEGAPLTDPRLKMYNNMFWMGYVAEFGAKSSMLDAEQSYGETASFNGHPEADMGQASCLYTFGIRDEVKVFEPVYYDEMTRSYYYPAVASRTPVITQATAMYLISNVSSLAA
jgi:hypothetical protein